MTPPSGTVRSCLGGPVPEAGGTLLPVMLLMLLFTAIALGAAVVVRVEVLLQDRFTEAAEGFYGAEAGLAAALAELRSISPWTPVLDGSRTSDRSVGDVSGAKAFRGASVIVCCGPGSAADRLARETIASPARARRDVRWQPFLWTPFSALTSDSEAQRDLFLIVWVADDEEDDDGNVAADANEIVIVRAEAIHPGGLRRVVEAYVGRRTARIGDDSGEGVTPGSPMPSVPAPLVLLRWREVR